jgi:hypothetical protein
MLIYIDFYSFPLGFAYFPLLSKALFPRVPELSVVIYVVKNASLPIAGYFLPARDGKRFMFWVCSSGRLNCNSAETVMQGLSASDGTQNLRDCKQRRNRPLV